VDCIAVSTPPTPAPSKRSGVGCEP
jgi:hypothetical protein